MLSHFLRKLSCFTARPGTESARAGGQLWHVASGQPVPDLPGWQSAGQLRVVKQNLQRTISIAVTPTGSVYVKECRANTPRAWLRELVRPAKARLEFENARRLAELGIPAIEPIAWGSKSRWRPGESTLVSVAHRGVPFLELIETPGLSPARRRQSARSLARFLARLHDAGVAHPDPHPGNFLAEHHGDALRFVLTDLHAVRFGSPLSWSESRANLTLLNRYFQLRATRTDRLRFWKAYFAHRRTLGGDADELARDLERVTADSNCRFWANRRGRYTGNNREFHKVRGPAASGYAVRELPTAVLGEWLADPDRLFTQPGIRLLKDSRTSTVAETIIHVDGVSRPVIGKRFRIKGRLGLVKNLFRTSPGLRSWLSGNGLRDRDLPTARPLAYFQRRRFGLPAEGYIIFDKVPDATELAGSICRSDAPALADRLGRLMRQMHDRQVSHRDLKAPNILLTGTGADPVLIDLVGVVAGRMVSTKQRVRDLARLNASFIASTTVTRSDRLRFLRTYLSWGLHGQGDWKTWWKAVDRATRVKQAKNARTGRPIG